ncbi:conserved exported hypothetical protein [Candidatus Sulfopaludibacter sp. SbA6]|nr:conserved exported hypothetical protein [Candidatus Sulfopaludibacter sp. SbA6]
MVKLQIAVVLACGVLASCARVRVAHAPVPAPVPSSAIPRPAALDDPQEDREDEARGAAEFYLLKRAPDGQNLPVERYLRARQAARRMRTYSSARRSLVANIQPHDAIQQPHDAIQLAGTGNWIPLGPGNIGGRTRALAIHPSTPATMYAGTSGGGVWKTTDGGATWVPLSDLLPSIAVDALAMDPNAPDTLYAGTGEPLGSVARRGAGIFKTTDGGATWNQLPGTATPDFYYVNQIVVSPANGNNLYAATATGVFFSPDGGSTWLPTLDRSAPNTGCQDLAIRTGQGADYLFAACGWVNSPASAIFRNTDAAGAGTWTQVLAVPGMGRSSIVLAPSNQSTIYALLSSVDPANPDFMNALLGVYRSDSNGDPGTWTALVRNTDSNRTNVSLLSYPGNTFGDLCGGARGSANGQGWLDIVIAVDPLNPERVWAGGIDIFRSDDGGRNWGIAMFWESPPPQGAHPDNHQLVFHPAYDGVDNQTLYNTSDGGVYLTQNANAPVATGDSAGCFPFQTQVAWQSLNNSYAVTEFHYGAPYPGGQWYWGGTQDNGTVRGSDGQGANAWTTLDGGDGGYVAVNPANANVIYHEFTGLSLSKSVDGGRTFAGAVGGIAEPAGNFLFIAPLALDPGSPDRLYTGGQTLWRTGDGAANWSAVSAAIPSGGISTIAVSPADPNRVLFGTSTGSIYRNPNALAADGNTAWDFAIPRSGFVAALAFDPNTPDTVYAAYSTFTSGTQNYTYKSVDGGATWTGIDGTGDLGLPDAPVSSILVDPLNPTTIYAGADLGVFVSLDGGATWAREDAPYADAPVVNLALDRNAGLSNLFAFTIGRGVWRISLPDSGSPCQYAVSSGAAAFPAYGGTASLDVTTGSNCMWVAVGDSNFSVQSPATGVGSGTASIAAQTNTGIAARSGTVYVQDQAIPLTQSAPLVAGGNDEAAGAQSMAAPYVGIEDTRSLTSNPADPAHSCTGSADFKTAWWRLVPNVSGTLVLSVQGERYDVGGNSGVVLTVYDTGAAAANELACIVRPRDTSPWQMVSTPVPVAAGKTYLIEVSATGNTANDGGYTILAAGIQ